METSHCKSLQGVLLIYLYIYFSHFLNKISLSQGPPCPLPLTQSSAEWMNLFLVFFFLWKVRDITLNIAVNVMADTGGASGPLWFQLLNLPLLGLDGCKKHISMVTKAIVQGMAGQVMGCIQVLSACLLSLFEETVLHFEYWFLYCNAYWILNTEERQSRKISLSR